MRPLVAASVAGTVASGFVFALDAGWQCRIFILDDDLFRVLFVPEAGLKEPRTWSIAPSGVDVPWQGRDGLGVSGFAGAAARFQDGPDDVTIATRSIRLRIRLSPFGLTWEDAAGVTFDDDRRTHAYEWSERKRLVRHYVTRATSDQYFGLGDKTGPLDKHGRRFRSVALDALASDARTSDPLYKHWPFLIQRDPGSGIAFGQF